MRTEASSCRGMLAKQGAPKALRGFAAWRRRGAASRDHELSGQGRMELIEVRVCARRLRNYGEAGVLLERGALELPVFMSGGPRHDEVGTGVLLNPDQIRPG